MADDEIQALQTSVGDLSALVSDGLDVDTIGAAVDALGTVVSSASAVLRAYTTACS